ncbi:mannitol dehydrogenase family protein [Thorsellia kenyensis]|uniref:Mannitol dehydrogenase family protein n=1 Tax=Thorsellia kenyensis TaxID=1549888 RepID=A0ABV6CC96_9GAMM
MTFTASNSEVQVQKKLLKPKIIHLGFGAFHRAHQARYFDELYKKGESDYGICGVNLYSGVPLIQSLKLSNYQYPILEQTATSSDVINIDSVVKCLHPQIDGSQAIIEQIADCYTEIVSLTITEKGYYIDEATQRLDILNPYIAQDLNNLHTPQTAIGYIVAGLKLRYERDMVPITILSCDNLQNNGNKIRIAVIDFAHQIDPGLANWISTHICFPSTMVDRIVPAMTETSFDEFTKITRLSHPGALMTESFRQWVVEDNFAQPRPKLELVGVQFVKDVMPFEEMKLGMLNASHSFLAYLGFLGGFKTIDEVINEESFRQATLDLMIKYQIPTLKITDQGFLIDYAYALIKRFSNPHLKHQTQQIAQDGSLKIPQRLLHSLKWHLAQNTVPILPALAIVGWMRYVAGINESGEVFNVVDPKSQEFKSIYQEYSFTDGYVETLLSISTIFGQDLGKNTALVNTLCKLFNALNKHGAKVFVKQLVTQEYKL